jgi:hypothetical protein
VPGRNAYALLNGEQRQLLKAQDLAGLQELIDRLAIRQLPGTETTETDWLRVWTEFKAAVRR